jgi:hypothetical protein
MLHLAEWAHDVRLDANDQRHPDDMTPLPVEDDAKRSIGFAFGHWHNSYSCCQPQ